VGLRPVQEGVHLLEPRQYKDAVTPSRRPSSSAPSSATAEGAADRRRGPQGARPVYAEYGKADEAYGFFSPSLGRQAGDKTKTIGLLEKLGEEYLGRAHPMEAKSLYIQLKGHTQQLVLLDTRITEAVINNSPKDKPAIRAQLAMLTKASYLSRQRRSRGEEEGLRQPDGRGSSPSTRFAWSTRPRRPRLPARSGEEGSQPKARPATCNKDTIASSIDVFELILKNSRLRGYKFNVKNSGRRATVPK